MGKNNGYLIDMIISNEELNEENNYLYYYRNMYNGYQRLKEVYSDGFNPQKTMQSICKYSNTYEAAQEMIELSSLIACLLSILIGLNREELQDTNAKISNRGLFKYADYKNSAKILNLGPYNNYDDYMQKYCKHINFNPTFKGHFLIY